MKKEAVSILTTEFREETHKQEFGALQYMEAFSFLVNPTDHFIIKKDYC